MKHAGRRARMRDRASYALANLAALAGLAIAVANACSATEADATSSTGDPSGPGSGASGPAGPGAGGSGQGGGVDIDASGPGSGGGSDRDACAAVTSEAQAGIQPADIIIAVDTSGSMDQEAAEVQQNLSNFAQLIVASGIDVHVILIADDGVCIPAPLGSGSCPADDNLPGYQHVHQGVGSTNGLEIILNTYPQWKGSLRSNATKTIAIVSDDNSDMSAADFTNQLLALDPPTFQGFKFDAIIAFEDPGVCTACFFNCGACASKCCDKAQLCVPLSAAEGSVYKQLVTQTMGVIGDLCDQNFDPVFQDMATSVVMGSKVACDFEIPQPDGGTLDPAKVNVEYTPGGMGNPNPILNVPGGLADCGMNGGWYYDDNQNPTTIILCPATCTVVQADPKAKMAVLFGCETQIAPPR